MTRKPSSAPERRDAVEQRVVDAVERLLDRGLPFTELSVATIAEEAGMSPDVLAGFLKADRK